MPLIVKSVSILLDSNSQDTWEQVWSGETCVRPIENVTGNKILGSLLQEVDLKTKYNVPSHIIDSVDRIGHRAIACGMECLSQANISIYNTKNRIIGVPADIRKELGIVSAGIHLGLLDSIRQDKDNIDPSFIYRVSVPHCGPLAQVLRSNGPTMAVQAACASTLYALSVAQDWIRVGRCKKVLIVAADSPTEPELIDMMYNGFDKIGVTTKSTNVAEAVSPFGTTRSGMILGSGAIGMLVEHADSALPGDIEIVDTSISNAAYHITSLDPDFIIETLKEFMTKICDKLSLPLEEIKSKMMYFSHETSSPTCASTEVEVLKSVFGDISDILICNTKGITGHSMGTSYEDPIAFESLRTKRVPIIHSVLEPSLGNIMVPRDSYHNRSFVLRFSAGLGSFTGFGFYRVLE